MRSTTKALSYSVFCACWLLSQLLLTPSASFAQSVYAPYTFITLAGSPGVSGSVDGIGKEARFSSPHGVALDSAGNIYVADLGNSTIRKITPDGTVCTIAGSPGLTGTADGVGPAARFYSPRGVAVNAQGIIFVTDALNHTIRVIGPSNLVSTLAGTPGSTGSTDGTGRSAKFDHPTYLAVDSAGNIFVTDSYNHTIRKIAPGAVVSTFAGAAGTSGITDGLASQARFKIPTGIAIDPEDNIFIADQFNHTIRKITTNGITTTLAGSPGNYGSADGTGSAARFYYPHGCALDGVGNLYVSEFYNDTVRRITPGGVVTTLAGHPQIAGSVDGTGEAVRFSAPRGGAMDAYGNFYLPDFGNNTIRKGWAAQARPVLSFSTPEVMDDLLWLNFTIWTGSASGLGLLEADYPEGPWRTNVDAGLMTRVPAVSYQFAVPKPETNRFFRVQAQIP